MNEEYLNIINNNASAYLKFRKAYPEDAKIIENDEYDGWEITRMVCFGKWEAFLRGYQSSTSKVNKDE